MSDEFTSVLSSWSVEDAHLARIRLAAEGIEGHLDNEMMVGMAWLDANAIRGVKLLVRTEDAARAHEILHSERHSESAVDSTLLQPPERSESDDADIQLTPSDEDDEEQDNERTEGTLTAMRKTLKGPVIWFFLAPMLLLPVYLIASFLAAFFRVFGL